MSINVIPSGSEGSGGWRRHDAPHRPDPSLTLGVTHFDHFALAITFNSTSIGVGRESTPTVVRVGCTLPKYSA